jgi:endoglucanase
MRLPLFELFRSWIAGLCIALALPAAYGQQMATTPAGFQIKRGVNLSHWLSQNFGWSPKDTFITEKDIAFISSVGYDHVRLPIDEAEMWDDSGKPIEASFSYLTNCLNWCAKHNLRVIVDLHILRSHHFNAENEGGKITLWSDSAQQDKFIQLWRELSARLKQYPVDRVAYELMNEPVAPDPEDWNKLIAKSIHALRQSEPQRVFIVGANRWQIPESFPFLKVPTNDPNIILSMHTYAPLFFTHHLADWTSFKAYTGPVQYPGRVVPEPDLRAFEQTNKTDIKAAAREAREIFDKQRLAKLLKPALQRAKELNLPLYCGEFGCLPHVDRGQRMKYYADIIAVFEEHGVAWCNWEYKGDFGLYKFDFQKKTSLEPDQEFIDVLMRKKK